MQKPSRQRYEDEHMTHYEWSGAGTGMMHLLPTGSRRDHPWHASSGILALLTTLLILNGCDRQGPAEHANAHIEDVVRDIQASTQGTPPTDAAPPKDAGAPRGPDAPLP